jgi:hypothetical protein
MLLEQIRELQPRDRLVELQIGQELGTSQAPVREALKEDLRRKPTARSGSTSRRCERC